MQLSLHPQKSEAKKLNFILFRTLTSDSQFEAVQTLTTALKIYQLTKMCAFLTAIAAQEVHL